MLGAVLLLGLLGAGSDVPERTATRVAQSRADLARYAKSHAIDDLNAAVADLYGTFDIEDISAENFTATRRVLVQAWANALKAIEAAYDPAFDPNDPKNRVPGCLPSPLPTPAGSMLVQPGFHSGLLTCSDEINRRWEHYSRILHIDQLAVGGFEGTVQMFNSVAPVDFGFDYDALDRILQQTGINKAHRARIDQALVDSGPHNVRVPTHTSDHDVPADIVQSIGVSSAALARYSSSHVLSDLDQAVDALDGPVEIDLLKWNFEKTRDALVQTWGAVIKRIEDAYSPSLSPNSYILVRKLDNRAIGSFVALLRQFNGDCSSCAQSSADLDKLLQQAGLRQATRARIVSGTARMLPLASP